MMTIYDFITRAKLNIQKPEVEMLCNILQISPDASDNFGGMLIIAMYDLLKQFKISDPILIIFFNKYKDRYIDYATKLHNLYENNVLPPSVYFKEMVLIINNKHISVDGTNLLSLETNKFESALKIPPVFVVSISVFMVYTVSVHRLYCTDAEYIAILNKLQAKQT